MKKNALDSMIALLLLFVHGIQPEALINTSGMIYLFECDTSRSLLRTNRRFRRVSICHSEVVGMRQHGAISTTLKSLSAHHSSSSFWE